MNSKNFYQNLKSFADFLNITDDSYFTRVPDSWHVVITDVKNSTAAIESGRYKEVNTIGAAAIACINNCLNEEEVPYVFGGDGATILISSENLQTAAQHLSGLKRLAKERFELELRICQVPVSELYGKGARVEVARHELSHGKCVAVFRGGGLALAEELIKENPDKYDIDTSTAQTASLKGLSCRWKPIPAKRGKIISLLLLSRKSDSIYTDFLEKLNEIYQGDLASANPINLDKLEYYSVNECRRDEIRYQFKMGQFFGRFMEIILAVLIFKYKAPIFKTASYTAAMRSHSDYRKFDDMLRMVLDCSSKQVEQIENCLKELYKDEEIYYGLFESNSALMTCYVNSTKDGKHVHFVDGSDGGYAKAAIQLKEQIKLSKTII